MNASAKTRRTRRLALVALAATGVGWFVTADSTPSADPGMAENRLWVERMPQDSREMFGKFLLLRTRDGNVGLVGRSSTWRHHYELFLWKRMGEKLRAFFPQDHVRDACTVRTWSCEGEAPEPFELCLELCAGDRRAVMYSMRSWEVRPGSTEDDLAAIAAEYPRLGTAPDVSIAVVSAPTTPWDASADTAPEISRALTP